MTTDAVLLMAYGSPDSLDQVEPYYTDIRRGSPPPPHLLEELIGRYRAIGGGSPLSRIVEAQRAAVEAELAARSVPWPVFAGMRHIAPRIGDIVKGMAGDGVQRFVAIALAPQASSNAAGYRRAVDTALAELGDGAPTVAYVVSWHDQPRFIEALAETTREAIARFDDPSSVRVMFTAHSLPARVVADGDPYPDELAATASLVAGRLGLERYDFAFQSAGRTGEPWLGPDILDEIRRLAVGGRAGARHPAGRLRRRPPRGPVRHRHRGPGRRPRGRDPPRARPLDEHRPDLHRGDRRRRRRRPGRPASEEIPA